MVDPSPESIEAQQQAFTALPCKIRWKNDQRKRAKRKTAVRTATASPWNQHVPAASGVASPSLRGEDTNTESNGHLIDADEVDEVVDPTDTKALVKAPSAFVVPWIAPINSQTRMLMSHCEFYISAPFGEYPSD